MTDPGEAKFQWGQRVVAGVDLFNDGSFPDRAEDSLLVEKGTLGEVVQVGFHVDSNVPVYLVEFAHSELAGCVVGCVEEEIFSI